MATSGEALTCPSCGSRHASEHRFCGICGAELRAGQSTPEGARDAARPAQPVRPRDQGVEFPRQTPSAEPTYTQQAEDALPYYIPPARVILLTLLSSGLYVFYWMYVTWRQYRDHTGEIAYPVMHALALMVPVYQFFRLHAHIRVYQELMEQRGVPTTLNPLRAVLIYFGVVLLGMVSLMIPAEQTVTLLQQATYVIINVGQASLLAWIMWQAQTNLNRFWRHRLGMRLGWIRISVPELALVAVGFLLGWGMLLILLVDPSLLTTGGVPDPSTSP